MRARKTSVALRSSSNSFAKRSRSSFRVSASTRRFLPLSWCSRATALTRRSNQMRIRRAIFNPGPDVNYITLTTEVRGEQDPFTVIFHEFTHLLVNNTFSDAPVWFNEGLAEYYSTFSITDDQKVVLGKPIGSHVFLLRQNKILPLKTLFAVDQRSPYYNERDKQSIFYAQSWALMHYLIVGKEGRAEKLGKFLQLMGPNMPVEQAFQQAFGVPFEPGEKGTPKA